MRNPATQATVRINNQKLIIEYLLEKGASSRALISKELNISKPTISLNVEKLLEKEILLELGEGKSSGGRKPLLIDFNYDFKIIIAIDLNRNTPLLALSNLSGEIISQELIKGSIVDEKEELINKLFDSIEHLIKINKYTIENLGAISIAIPGVIDEATGNIFANPQFNLWIDMNLKEILGKRYNTKIILKNDISMAALGEKHYGIGKFYEDLVFVSVGRGVGAGIIINGKLYEGKRKAAGEIGYSKLFNYNSKKNLEDVVSTTEIFKRIEKDLVNGVETCISNEITIDSIKKALDLKDEYVSKVIREIGLILGMSIVNIAVVLDLEIIILGGAISELDEYLINPIMEVVKDSLPFDTVVKKSEIGKIAGIYGLFVVANNWIMKGLID